MRRYPDGAFGKAFFQKDAPSHMPDWIPTFRAPVSTRGGGAKREVDFPVVDDELALLWMVNMGCIDMNPWYSRVDRPDRPDFVLFDLDPTPEVPYAQTVEVALIVKALLDGLGLASFPKTSGGKGFHMLVPLDRRSTYEDSRSFAELVAGTIARAYPKLATTAVGEVAAPRRADRREPERAWARRSPRSTRCGRTPARPSRRRLRWEEVDRRSRPGRVHDGRRARPGRTARRPLRRRARDAAVALEGVAGPEVSSRRYSGPA